MTAPTVLSLSYHLPLISRIILGVENRCIGLKVSQGTSTD